MRRRKSIVMVLVTVAGLGAECLWSQNVATGYAIPPVEVVDSTGKVVGQFLGFGRATTVGGVANILLRVGGLAVPMQVMRDRLLAERFVVFTTTDCTGTAYILDPDAAPDLNAMLGIAYAMGPGDQLYRSRAGAVPGSQSIQSIWIQPPPFSGPPGGPPSCEASVGTQTVVEAEPLLDLDAVFDPPFTIQ